MNERSAALYKVQASDIVLGQSFDDVPLICLVTFVGEHSIHARTVTTQYDLCFDRSTGVAEWGDGHCEITTVAKLPVATHNALLDLDAHYQSKPGPEDCRLTREHIDALLVTKHFKKAHMLPAAVQEHHKLPPPPSVSVD